ncbi:MAG: glycosyltransferase family 39 protein [Acidobacteriota bacterium]|nr:glycosyltransferase family 39 protein [Acidobacteriota bacterium]
MTAFSDSAEGIQIQDNTGSVRRLSRPLLWAILAALAIRLAVASFCYTGIMNPERNHWPFGYETGRIAASIATGHGYGNPLFFQTGPTAWMTPGYPYLLAGVFKLFGVYTTASALVILALQALFAALTCIPIFLIARRWFGNAAAQWSVWIWALFPYGVFLASDFVWENCLTALLLTTLVWLTLDMDRRRSLWAWTGYGLLWGATALVNPSVLTVLPLAAGWALWRKRRDGFAWRAPALAMLAVVLAVLAPWEIRNYRTFHQWVPLRDNFWLEVWVDNNGDTSLRWAGQNHPSGSAAELNQYDTLGEMRYMAYKREQALGFIEAHPAEYLLLCFRRFVFTWTGYWNFEPVYVSENPYDGYNILLVAPLTMLLAIGLTQAIRRRLEGAGLLGSILAIYPVVYYLTAADMRYRHVVDPMILIGAAFGILAVRERVRLLAPGKSVETEWEEFPVEIGEGKY